MLVAMMMMETITNEWIGWEENEDEDVDVAATKLFFHKNGNGCG